jgi:hypothetical protein
MIKLEPLFLSFINLQNILINNNIWISLTNASLNKEN